MCKHFSTLAPLSLWHFRAALGLAWAGAPRSDVRHDHLLRARRVHLLVARRARTAAWATCVPASLIPALGMR